MPTRTSCASWTATRPWILPNCCSSRVQCSAVRPTSSSDSDDPRCERHGRCMHVSRIATSRVTCRAASGSPSMTSARCAPPAVTTLWRSSFAIGAPAGHWRWCSKPRPRAGESRSIPSTTDHELGRSKVTGTVKGTVNAVQRHAAPARRGSMIENDFGGRSLRRRRRPSQQGQTPSWHRLHHRSSHHRARDLPHIRQCRALRRRTRRPLASLAAGLSHGVDITGGAPLIRIARDLRHRSRPNRPGSARSRGRDRSRLERVLARVTERVSPDHG